MANNEITSITPADAWQMVQDNPRVLLIDVRSSMEFLFVGHPVGAVHIPWIDEPDWEINEQFATEVRKLVLGGIHQGEKLVGAPIILICRSGKRSLEAGKRLIEERFTEVFNIDEGFEGELNEQHQRSSVGGWRFRELPWEQC
ncbi:MAG: rhodanese-like domain-containing protein [Gammaproteobacteria bacterium]|jgi:rhodanese-related sulfurtransferase|nr:rhodanese-like domain-containing protein [Gammaproteobacteria bacterium]MBT7307061.1 rhodanese-like domain-containing protein [Gammaproteobacteria bacterium]